MSLFLNRPAPAAIRSRHIQGDRLHEFPSRGCKQRYVFPHSIYYLPKPGPDGFKLAHRMCGSRDLSRMFQIVLFADRPAIDEFPDQLFFDDDLLWHQQQFGLKGQIATAGLVIKGKAVHCLAPHSDLVQRISRYRQYKTRVEKVFKGWMHMLLNGVMNFALEKNLSTVCVPTSVLALQNTDRSRNPGVALFQRIYDEYVQQLFEVRQRGKWWEIGVDKNNQKIVRLDKTSIPTEEKITICICHNITGSAVDGFYEKNRWKCLEQMLAIERRIGIKATYQVMGMAWGDTSKLIQSDGHCISFYSYDATNAKDQLGLCRKLDYRIKGYSPFDSVAIRKVSDQDLALHNFEWIARSHSIVGTRTPVLENGIVRIPLHFDDWGMVHSGLTYSEWEKKAIAIIRGAFISFHFNDSNGSTWLPSYESFLERLLNSGEIKTLNEVSIQTILHNSL